MTRSGQMDLPQYMRAGAQVAAEAMQTAGAADQRRESSPRRRESAVPPPRQSTQQPRAVLLSPPQISAAEPRRSPSAAAQRAGGRQRTQSADETPRLLPCERRRDDAFAVHDIIACASRAEAPRRARLRLGSGGPRRRLALAGRRQPCGTAIGAAVESAVAAALAGYRDGIIAGARPPQRDVADGEPRPDQQRPQPLHLTTAREDTSGAVRRRSEQRTAPADDSASAARPQRVLKHGHTLRGTELVGECECESSCSELNELACSGASCCKCQTSCAQRNRRYICAVAQQYDRGSRRICPSPGKHCQCCCRACTRRDPQDRCRRHETHCQALPHSCLLSYKADVHSPQAGSCMASRSADHCLH